MVDSSQWFNRKNIRCLSLSEETRDLSALDGAGGKLRYRPASCIMRTDLRGIIVRRSRTYKTTFLTEQSDRENERRASPPPMRTRDVMMAVEGLTQKTMGFCHCSISPSGSEGRGKNRKRVAQGNVFHVDRIFFTNINVDIFYCHFGSPTKTFPQNYQNPC
jgi:hypothetical protein